MQKRTVKILHAYGYADLNDGRDPIPVPPNSGASGKSASCPHLQALSSPKDSAWA